MELQLIKGAFTKDEALDIVAQMLQVKIRFHENKIQKSHNEEDIKMRETRIKQLQQQFYELKQSFDAMGKVCEVNAVVTIQ